jgi:hypothetical protein
VSENILIIGFMIILVINQITILRINSKLDEMKGNEKNGRKGKNE